MSTANIYQIYYNEQSRQALDNGFIPLDNTDNQRPDWSEFWVIRRFLMNTPLIEDQWYGFFSPKFSMKTGLSSTQVRQFTSTAPSDTDVLLLSPFWDINAFFLNVFDHGNYWHPGLIDIAQRFFQSTGTPIDLQSMVMHSGNTVYCNYFLAKPRFWRRWIEIGEQLFQCAESTNNPFHLALTAGTSHTDAFQFSMKVFLQERIASFLLSHEKWNTKNYPIFQTLGLFTDLKPFRSELIACDALKTQYAYSGDMDFLKEYKRLRNEISRRVNLPIIL